LASKYLVPKSAPEQSRYEQAIEEIKDIKGLSLIRNVMEKYNLSFVTIDFKLNITAKRSRDYCPKRDKEKL
jgi:hypothetical protein